MTYRFIYKGRWDYRRFNREWRQLYHHNSSFSGLDKSLRKSGDSMLLQIMADIALEHGYELLSIILRQHIKIEKR